MSVEREFTCTGSPALCALDQAITRIFKVDQWLA